MNQIPLILWLEFGNRAVSMIWWWMAWVPELRSFRALVTKKNQEIMQNRQTNLQTHSPTKIIIRRKASATLVETDKDTFSIKPPFCTSANSFTFFQLCRHPEGVTCTSIFFVYHCLTSHLAVVSVLDQWSYLKDSLTWSWRNRSTSTSVGCKHA